VPWSVMMGSECTVPGIVCAEHGPWARLFEGAYYLGVQRVRQMMIAGPTINN
jgi:hypothetical protein